MAFHNNVLTGALNNLKGAVSAGSAEFAIPEAEQAIDWYYEYCLEKSVEINYPLLRKLEDEVYDAREAEAFGEC